MKSLLCRSGSTSSRPAPPPAVTPSTPPELQLLAETEITTASKPAIQHEYVWFAGEPLAQITATTIHWYFNDHLGTPILQTDATPAPVWRTESDPYGTPIASTAGANKHQPLRFPGQENDGSTELSYNVFRWYRAGWGRYTQSDPIERRAIRTRVCTH